MNIAYLRLSPDFPPAAELPGHVIRCAAAPGEWMQEEGLPEGVVIGTDDPALAEACLRAVRSRPAAALIPVVLLQDLGHRLARICDGVARSLTEAAALMAPIRERTRELPADILSHGADFRLLAYLYCRPSALLEPDRQWDSARVYTYPAAELLADPEADIERWLEKLLDRGYLERAQLVDRLRDCPACGGRHHNYVDVCPHSGSIDIVQKPFLHCFTCGHVGPEESFLTGGALVCPKCTARLRHIGADYDRPLENYVCNHCGQSFIEPAVIARCLACGAKNAAESLVPQPIYAFRLSEQGRLAARTGSLQDIYAPFDRLNYVRPAFFEALLDWLLALCRRHADERFSLLGIRLGNVLELTERLGRFRAAELVDEFAARLRETIRRTDLTTRTDQRTLWVLLPKTECPDCHILLSRLEEIRRGSRQPEGIELAFTVASFSAPADLLPAEPAALLMARLAGSLA
jgi:GGDEF domain-containing protein